MQVSVTPAAGPTVQVCKVKATDQSVSNSAALSNDDTLLFTIAAGETWIAVFTLSAVFGAVGLLQVAVTTPASPTTLLVTAVIDSTGLVPVVPTPVTSSGSALTLNPATATSGTVTVTATIVNGSTAGIVTLQFAQAVSNGTATTIKAGSSLVAIRK